MITRDGSIVRQGSAFHDLLLLVVVFLGVEPHFEAIDGKSSHGEPSSAFRHDGTRQDLDQRSLGMDGSPSPLLLLLVVLGNHSISLAVLRFDPGAADAPAHSEPVGQ